ncbi:hypothetical protein [Borrelia miyamotoi]|uniref:Uncharacterized protein n=1 Tax=Borrelia miyamotoi TaxID=47466 RepID=A0AAQ3AGD9_9SPIR|nr:hypothetical protein [Borrelia miyamotoi]WAZ84953.1 hypothetical protein O5400_00995 [Borrelia miyamotoi]WAZ90737.1 hypothetical protein O5398_00995 [Borrelia miyamotoi]WAZ92018.1 hypothetical protein O5402_00995 [Borrelia miyamotoi]WAZ93311.1 hypothetical protein O5399_00995 [Borrelia miyamotoi]WAZ94605.1 hypothetical protein O5397_00995 [Borrelia miyamotoi]
MSDLSICIDLTRCFSYAVLNKILRELYFDLEILCFPKINTLYIKYETLGFGNSSGLEFFLASLSENCNFVKLDEFTFELHPDEVTLYLLSILNDFSVSRVSLDINSFASKFLGVMDAFRVPVCKKCKCYS